MTKEHGVVAVTSQVPSLGKVIGTKTEQEILGGTSSEQAKDEPAVVNKPLAKKTN